MVLLWFFYGTFIRAGNREYEHLRYSQLRLLVSASQPRLKKPKKTNKKKSFAFGFLDPTKAISPSNNLL